MEQEKAYGDLAECLHRIVYNYLYRYRDRYWYLTSKSNCALSELASDIVQDTLLKLFQGTLDRYRPLVESTFIAWAAAVAINGARQWLRRQRPGVPLEAPTQEADGEEGFSLLQVLEDSRVVLPDDSVVVSEMFAVVMKAFIHCLTHREQQVFAMRILGYPPAEIAELLDIARSTVDVHIHNARKKLKRALLAAGYTVEDIP